MAAGDSQSGIARKAHEPWLAESPGRGSLRSERLSLRRPLEEPSPERNVANALAGDRLLPVLVGAYDRPLVEAVLPVAQLPRKVAP